MTTLGLVLLAGCGPGRESRSQFEVLLAGLPAGPREIRYQAGAEQQQISDGTVTVTVGVGAVDSLSGQGVAVGEFRVDEATGRVGRPGFLLVGPPGRADAALEWLADPRKSAASDPDLLALARALGEPAQAAVHTAPAGCGPRLIASARRGPDTDPNRNQTRPSRAAWVAAWSGARAAADASASVDRVREAVAERPPPGRVLQVDLRPRYIVVTYEGADLGDPVPTFCKQAT